MAMLDSSLSNINSTAIAGLSGGSSGPPTSVLTITSSYAIPVGRYARVVYSLLGTATFIVNGSTIASTGTSGTFNSSPLRYQTNGTSNNLATVTNPNGSGSANQGAAYGFGSVQDVGASYINVPTGTVLSGTGTWKAFVELYT